MDEKILELSLLLMFLNGWSERSFTDPKKTVRRSWKKYPFTILNELRERNFISHSNKSKTMVFTRLGLKKAEEIKKKYF